MNASSEPSDPRQLDSEGEDVFAAAFRPSPTKPPEVMEQPDGKASSITNDLLATQPPQVSAQPENLTDRLNLINELFTPTKLNAPEPVVA